MMMMMMMIMVFQYVVCCVFEMLEMELLYLGEATTIGYTGSSVLPHGQKRFDRHTFFFPRNKLLMLL